MSRRKISKIQTDNSYKSICYDAIRFYAASCCEVIGILMNAKAHFIAIRTAESQAKKRDTRKRREGCSTMRRAATSRTKTSRVDEERVYEVVTQMISEKTGEPRGAILARIARRAAELQRRSRTSRQSMTKRSGFTSNIQAKLAAKSRT